MSTAPRLPYPGLRAFGRDEADLFFGRENCVDEMVDRLAQTRFLAVLGASGSGKSSLVRTGLFDALELGLHAKAGTQWHIVDMHPGGQPMHNLAAGLLRLSAKRTVTEMDVALLASFLARGPRSLIEWCNDSHLDPGWNLVVLVDQFEELFRFQAYSEREEAEAFIALLLESAAAPGAALNVIITMRSEYLGSCALVPGLAERINRGLYLTPRMTREECRAAIEGPAGVAGFTVEPALVNRLLNDIATFAPWQVERGVDQLQILSRRADQLPLMQHVLNRLWVRAVETGGDVVLTLADYERIGGLRGALDVHASEVTGSLPQELRPAVETVFRALVSGTSLQNAVRRPCRFGELVRYAGGDRDTVVTVVDAFRAPGCNFLQPSISEPLTDETVVDISHESLIRQWSSLSEWFEHEARAAQTWRRLVSAMEHHAAGEGDLLSGLDLANFDAWWARENPNAAWAERYGNQHDASERFLNESRAAERKRTEAERRRQARNFYVVASLLAVFVGLTAISGFLFWARNEANAKLTQTNAQLTAASANLESTNLQLSKAAADLTDKNRLLQKATVDLEGEKNLALAAQQASETEKRKAQDAYSLAVQASDQFLTGIAEKLLTTSGVPKADVQQILDQADIFLDKLSQSAGSSMSALLARAKTHADLKLAELDAVRGDYGSMRSRAQAARTTLLAGRQEADLAGDDVSSLAQTYLTEGRSFVASGQFDKATDPLQKAKQIADKARLASPADRALIDATGISRYWISANELDLGHTAKALEAAKDCIADLNTGGQGAVTALGHLYIAKCEDILGDGTSATDADDAAQHYRDAVGEIGEIPETQRDRETLSVLGELQNKIGEWAERQDNSNTAYEYYSAAARSINQILARDPYDTQARDAYATSLSNIGNVYLLVAKNDSSFYKGAKNEFVEAYDARHSLYSQTGASEILWIHLEEVLDRLIFSIEMISNFNKNTDSGFDKDSDLFKDGDLFSLYAARLHEFIDVEEKLRKIADAQADQARLRNELDSKRRLIAALLESAGIPGAKNPLQAFQESDQLASDLLDFCDKGYEGASLDVALRRVCFETLINLPASRQSLPFLQVDNNVYAQIEALERSRARFASFLSRFRGVWKVEDKLGLVSAELANLYATKGQWDRAIRLAQASADLYNKEGVQLLIDWYSTGFGPISPDPGQAKKYQTLLSSRSWDTYTITLMVRSADVPTQTPAHYDIQRYAQFMDARFPGDDPVERMRSELETFEGFQIDPAELEELKGLLLKAEQEKRGFTESLAFEVGYAYSAASIALELEGDLSKGAIQAAVQMLQTQWSRNRGEEAVTNAITRLARNGASAALRGELLSVADELTAKNHDRASAAILTVLIETATGEPKDLAMLFVKRADLRAKANTMDLRDRDLEIALALAPGDPHIESLLGADWIEQDEYLASAATLMEHVLSLEPDNASVKDSLGWDYVKTGKLEQGVALLVQAVAARPDDPATLLHLAHAHRLAGDIELAKQELAKALSRDPNDHVYGLIESERDILTPASDKEPSEQESAAAIARAMEETDFYSSKAVSTDAVGLAISGFDPVAYFSRQQAVLGKGEYFTLWKGGLWLFASADDRARFVQHPDRYTPAFGGFCSYCLWVGNKYHGNPQVWAVYEGTLYLHSSKENLANWEESPDYFIEDAHIRWSKVDDEDVTPAASTRLSDEVSKLLETRRRLSALIRTTTEHRQSGDKTGALASVTEAYGLVQAEVAKAHPKVDENLATIAGNLAYEMLFTGDYAKALSLAEQGLDLDPQLIWIETNRAEALMFLGRIAEARAIYLQYRHFVLSDGKQWEDDVQSDFALLRAAGHTSPLMDEIEKAFQSPRQ